MLLMLMKFAQLQHFTSHLISSMGAWSILYFCARFRHAFVFCFSLCWTAFCFYSCFNLPHGHSSDTPWFCFYFFIVATTHIQLVVKSLPLDLWDVSEAFGELLPLYCHFPGLVAPHLWPGRWLFPGHFALPFLSLRTSPPLVANSHIEVSFAGHLLIYII